MLLSRTIVGPDKANNTHISSIMQLAMLCESETPVTSSSSGKWAWQCSGTDYALGVWSVIRRMFIFLFERCRVLQKLKISLGMASRACPKTMAPTTIPMKSAENEPERVIEANGEWAYYAEVGARCTWLLEKSDNWWPLRLGSRTRSNWTNTPSTKAKGS